MVWHNERFIQWNDKTNKRMTTQSLHRQTSRPPKPPNKRKAGVRTKETSRTPGKCADHLLGYLELSNIRKLKITFIGVWWPVTVNLNEFTRDTIMKLGVSSKPSGVGNTHTRQANSENRNKLWFRNNNVRTWTIGRENGGWRGGRRQTRTHSKICANRT